MAANLDGPVASDSLMRRISVIVFLLLTSIASAAVAQHTGPTIAIHRASGPITVDGDISDAGWQNAARIDQWWETNPGDNVTPKVKSTGWLTYDDRFFYAAFEFEDSDPSRISRQYGDHDSISGNTDDYAGVIIDARNDGKTAILFLATPRGTQYDAVSDDTTGNEDSSPDFYWDSAAKITPKGWTLELRIPFSSLRYKKADPQTWGIILYRNWPRDRRYQMFSAKLPRGLNCFICNYNVLTGLEGLPAGGNLVVAPYVTAKEEGEVRNGLGSSFVNRPASGDGGVDLKWTPNADTAVDATINPDFSQIESDVAAITANERFAIFFPEKRPFFLEGIELFSTPIQAVYTRTITAPRWGLRSTGKFGQNAYTFLVADDRGGGSIILPSALGSDFADQDFGSRVAIGRMRHDWGKSFASVLFTDRENEGGGHNRVIGPDFQWRNSHDTITGQLLLSDSSTPNRTDLASEWDGRKLQSHAGDLWWSHSSKTWDFFSEYKDFGDEFRADNGFVPQVGYRSNFGEVGRTFRPKGFFSRVRVYAMAQYDSEQNGSMLYRLYSGGFGCDAKYRINCRFRYAYDSVRATDRIFQRHQFLYNVSFAVSRKIRFVSLSGSFGQQVDFSNLRLGHAADTNVSVSMLPTDHLDLQVSSGLRWLNLPNDQARLFTSQVERVRATYTFNNRMFLRGIVQNARTNRNHQLYTDEVDQHGGELDKQLLFAYKLNWQSVLYLGYGDVAEATPEEGNLEASQRSFFLKLSYAFQR